MTADDFFNLVIAFLAGVTVCLFWVSAIEIAQEMEDGE